jgi:hypothetical protein
MVDLTLGVDLQLKGLGRFKGGVRDAEGSLRRFGAAGRDSRGRFSSGVGDTYIDGAGRRRGRTEIGRAHV